MDNNIYSRLGSHSDKIILPQVVFIMSSRIDVSAPNEWQDDSGICETQTINREIHFPLSKQYQ